MAYLQYSGVPPDFHGSVPLADNISHTIFRATLKYANHPSSIAIKYLNNTSNVSVANVKKIET